MAVNPQNKKDIKDTLQVFEDGLNTVVASFSSRLKESFRDIDDNIASGIARNLGRQVLNDLNAAIRLSDKQVENQDKLEKGQLKSKDVEKELLQLRLKRAKADQNQRDLLKELGDAQFQALQENDLDRFESLSTQISKLKEEKVIADGILDSRKASGEQQLKDAISIEKSTGNLGELFKRLSKNKFFGSLINADGAMESMKKRAFQLQGKKGMSGAAKSMKIFGSGIQGMFKGFTKSLGIVGLILSAINFLVKSMFRADELTTSLAKNLDISKANAQDQVNALIQTTGALEDTSYVTEDLLKAQKELLDFQGAILQTTNETVKQQAFLTKFVGVQADKAAFLNTIYENQGTNAEIVYDQINATANAAAKLTGNFISAGSILREIGNSSESILANFGFSTKELTNAVLQTRRFGVSLTQASNIAGGLLDFEQSIASELEAEILLGKQFNFERARALAATGDIAGATEEVLKQTQNLSDEQLRSPIIQQSIAKATGLNADELVRSIQLTRALNKSQGQYDELLKKAATKAKRREIQEGILRGATAKEIQKNLTAQEQFNNALANAKDQFAAFVNAGFLDQFASILPDVLDKLAFLSGSSGKLRDIREAKNLGKRASNLKDENDKALLSEDQIKKITDAYEGDEALKRSLADVTFAGTQMGGLYSFLTNTFGFGTGLGRSSVDESQAVHNTLKEIHAELKKSGVINLDEQAFINRVITYDTK